MNLGQLACHMEPEQNFLVFENDELIFAGVQEDLPWYISIKYVKTFRPEKEFIVFILEND